MARNEKEREAVLRDLIEEERSMQLITLECEEYNFNRNDTLNVKYENELFANLVIKLNATSLDCRISDDYSVPIDSNDPDWAIVQLGNNHEFVLENILGSEHGKELLKGQYHPKTKSAFRRMITITLWHTLIYTETVKVDDPLLSNYAAELKSTVGTIPGSESFALLHGQSLRPTSTKIEELEKQEWWKDTVGQKRNRDASVFEQTRGTADAQNEEKIIGFLSILFKSEKNLRVIATCCLIKRIDYKKVLNKKYNDNRFTDLVSELRRVSDKNNVSGDLLVPSNGEDPVWKIVEKDYDYMYKDILNTGGGQELLKAGYHPKTKSVFNRMITIALWHMLIYTKTIEVDDPLVRKHAVELKSTVETIPRSEPFTTMHGLTHRNSTSVKDFLKHTMEKIGELEKQEWWKNTVVP